MHLTKMDIENLPRVKRLKLINSVSGIKPANLIGSISQDGVTNLAVFSSVIHLGSDPALLGFIMRPSEDVRRDTYANIQTMGEYTINHVHSRYTEQAHFTSAKFEQHESEFEFCGLKAEFHGDFRAPFVLQSHLKMGLRYRESIEIKANNTIMVVGEITHLLLPDGALDDNDYLDLAKIGSVGVGGLNSYYDVCNRRDYPYARRSDVPVFDAD